MSACVHKLTLTQELMAQSMLASTFGCVVVCTGRRTSTEK